MYIVKQIYTNNTLYRTYHYATEKAYTQNANFTCTYDGVIHYKLENGTYIPFYAAYPRNIESKQEMQQHSDSKWVKIIESLVN